MPKNLPALVEQLTKDQTIELAELCLAELVLADRIDVVLRSCGNIEAGELDELSVRVQEELDKLETEEKEKKSE